MKVRVSAPGKLMILGEHAVVYGYPCIVAAIDKRLRVTVSFNSGKEDFIETGFGEDSRYVESTLNLFRKKFNKSSKIKIITDSDFPSILGFGSSAAVTVATAKALSEVFEIPLSAAEIYKLAYEASFKVQRSGSGFDVAVSTFGGIIFYEKKGEIVKKLKIDKLPLVAIYSGVSADTGKLIERIKKKYKNKRKDINDIFKKIEILVVQGKKAIEKREWQKLAKIMNENHKLLKALGISTPKLNLLVETAVASGAWGAKLSGAGGGDCVIAITSPKKRKTIKEKIDNAGGQILDINFNGEGVRVE